MAQYWKDDRPSLEVDNDDSVRESVGLGEIIACVATGVRQRATQSPPPTRPPPTPPPVPQGLQLAGREASGSLIALAL